jgi:hypothetical protein
VLRGQRSSDNRRPSMPWPWLPLSCDCDCCRIHGNGGVLNSGMLRAPARPPVHPRSRAMGGLRDRDSQCGPQRTRFANSLALSSSAGLPGRRRRRSRKLCDRPHRARAYSSF